MGYEFREVKCYICKHIFMWKNEKEFNFYEFHLKDTDQILNYAKCPKCNSGMMIIPHVLEGISADNDNIIKYDIRGI